MFKDRSDQLISIMVEITFSKKKILKDANLLTSMQYRRLKKGGQGHMIYAELSKEDDCVGIATSFHTAQKFNNFGLTPLINEFEGETKPTTVLSLQKDLLKHAKVPLVDVDVSLMLIGGAFNGYTSLLCNVAQEKIKLIELDNANDHLLQQFSMQDQQLMWQLAAKVNISEYSGIPYPYN